MADTESEIGFVERALAQWVLDGWLSMSDQNRLFALARRGAGIVINEWPKTNKPARKVSEILAELDVLPPPPKGETNE